MIKTEFNFLLCYNIITFSIVKSLNRKIDNMFEINLHTPKIIFLNKTFNNGVNIQLRILDSGLFGYGFVNKKRF